jgi:hypothetical protein
MVFMNVVSNIKIILYSTFKDEKTWSKNRVLNYIIGLVSSCQNYMNCECVILFWCKHRCGS